MGKSNKGSPFERKFCKELSLWWTKGENDNVFWRTAGSGARATVRKKQGKKASVHNGDVDAIDPIGRELMQHITFELKRGYPKVSPYSFIDAPKNLKMLKAWIRQAWRSHKSSESKTWAIVHKRDYRETVILFPAKPLIKEYTDINKDRISCMATFLFNNREYIVMPLDVFFEAFTPEWFQK